MQLRLALTPALASIACIAAGRLQHERDLAAVQADQQVRQQQAVCRDGIAGVLNAQPVECLGGLHAGWALLGPRGHPECLQRTLSALRQLHAQLSTTPHLLCDLQPGLR